MNINWILDEMNLSKVFFAFQLNNQFTWFRIMKFCNFLPANRHLKFLTIEAGGKSKLFLIGHVDHMNLDCVKCHFYFEDLICFLTVWRVARKIFLASLRRVAVSQILISNSSLKYLICQHPSLESSTPSGDFSMYPQAKAYIVKEPSEFLKRFLGMGRV